MDYELKGYGFAFLDNDKLILRCNFSKKSDVIFSDFPEQAANLKNANKILLENAITTGKEIKLNQIQLMNIGAFFMSLNTIIMSKEMESLKTCGAAKFIPSEILDKNKENK